MLLLEHVVTCNHNNHTGKSGSQRRKNKAQLNTAKGGLIRKNTGNGANPRFVLSAPGQVFIILLAKVIDQRPVADVKLLQTNSTVCLEGENDNHHNRRHIDDEKHIRINVRYNVPYGVIDLLLLQFCLCLGYRKIMAFPLIG